MKKAPVATVLVLLALMAASVPAHALTITPVFDSCWMVGCAASGGAPAPAAATTVVNNVIAEFQADFSNPITITIGFGWGETNGSPVPSGASSNFNATDFPPPFGAAGLSLATVKADYATAVGLQPTNTALVTANAHLPAAYPNGGGSKDLFFVTDAQFKALTRGALNGDAIDGFTGYATNFCGGGICPYDFTGGKPGASAIDFTSVVEHELSHAMGRVDYAFVGGGPAPPFLTPLNFFTYAQNRAGGCGSTTLDQNFDITCFSIDGGATFPGPRTFSNTSDSGDWIGATGDSFNAFISQGEQGTVSAADILEMCALGWTACARVAPVPEPATLALLGTGLLGLAALRRLRK